MAEDTEVLTTEEAAELLRVSTKTKKLRRLDQPRQP